MSVGERHEFEGTWFQQPEEVLETWRAWVRWHCIDPREVAIPGFIERRPAKRQIAYETWKTDKDGRYVLDADGWPEREVRVVQLEAVPSPLPLEHGTVTG